MAAKDSLCGGVRHRQVWCESNVTCVVPGFWLSKTTTFFADTRGNVQVCEKNGVEMTEE